MYRILIVDDEPNILSALRRVMAPLRPEDFDGETFVFETFTSPLMALARADDIRIDMVLTDYRMPEMDGLTFLKAMIAKQPQMARLMMSGHADLDTVVACVNQAQVQRVIPKPWREGEVRAAIVEALRTQALALENQRLADTVRVQRERLTRHDAELRRLELECPGITRIERTDKGEIVLNDDEEYTAMLLDAANG